MPKSKDWPPERDEDDIAPWELRGPKVVPFPEKPKPTKETPASYTSARPCKHCAATDGWVTVWGKDEEGNAVSSAERCGCAFGQWALACDKERERKTASYRQSFDVK